MDLKLLHGELVRLERQDPEALAEAHARWSTNSTYLRLMNSLVPMPHSSRLVKSWLAEAMKDERTFFFSIVTQQEGKLIGYISLDGLQWDMGDTFVGMGIGETEEWDKGYGTDALRVILCYAFRELNLRRVSLDVFSYNQRAIRSYEKAGFIYEGRARGLLNREGERSDLIFMGILREEWEAIYGTDIHV